ITRSCFGIGNLSKKPLPPDRYGRPKVEESWSGFAEDIMPSLIVWRPDVKEEWEVGEVSLGRRGLLMLDAVQNDTSLTRQRRAILRWRFRLVSFWTACSLT